MEKEKDVKETSVSSTEVKETAKVEETASEKALKERVSQLSAEKKDLSEQLSALTQTVQGLINKKEVEEEDPNIDPEVKKVHAEIKMLKQALAFNFDNQDKLEVRLDPKINQKDYDKKANEIEKLREQYRRVEGKNVSRKEIYFFLKGQEAGQETETKEEKEETTTPMPETKTTTKETTTTPKTTADMEKELKDKVF